MALLSVLSSCHSLGHRTGPYTGSDDAAAGGWADHGAVAVPEKIAARVGVDILRQGGNAVDAAVAVQFALAVTFPLAGNLGGGGFMLVAEPDATVRALDYRETAPSAAHPDLYLDGDGNVVPGLSLWSHLAAGVPGTVMGMWQAHRRYGSLEWADLVAPAIALAHDGFELDQWTARSFVDNAAALRRNRARYRKHASFATYFRGSEGDRFLQPELAATLRRIAKQGPDGFYRGATADLIVQEMGRGNGIIDHSDLASYRAHWREPVEGRYRGHRVVSMPPPSSGGIALVQLFNMLQSFSPLPPLHSSEQVHLIAEIEKRVFADRALYLGDPDFYPVPVAKLIDREYAERRAHSISPTARTPPAKIRAGLEEGEQTTHFSIVDGSGMAVSNTTTLNAGYGSGIVVRGAGFLLNNEMDDFSAKPGVPNLYGVVGAEANKVEPGKRMLSSMSPTFVFRPDSDRETVSPPPKRERSGKLWLTLGTPGGPTIFTSVFQVVVNRIDYGLALEAAVAAPRFHHQWPPPAAGRDPIRIETDRRFAISRATRAGLEELGYSFDWRGNIGRIHAIEIDGDRIIGAADPRGGGVVMYGRPR